MILKHKVDLTPLLLAYTTAVGTKQSKLIEVCKWHRACQFLWA